MSPLYLRVYSTYTTHIMLCYSGLLMSRRKKEGKNYLLKYCLSHTRGLRLASPCLSYEMIPPIPIPIPVSSPFPLDVQYFFFPFSTTRQSKNKRIIILLSRKKHQ